MIPSPAKAVVFFGPPCERISSTIRTLSPGRSSAWQLVIPRASAVRSATFLLSPVSITALRTPIAFSRSIAVLAEGFILRHFPIDNGAGVDSVNCCIYYCTTFIGPFKFNIFKLHQLFISRQYVLSGNHSLYTAARDFFQTFDLGFRYTLSVKLHGLGDRMRGSALGVSGDLQEFLLRDIFRKELFHGKDAFRQRSVLSNTTVSIRASAST